LKQEQEDRLTKEKADFYQKQEILSNPPKPV
jgi:hypothetical protein